MTTRQTRTTSGQGPREQSIHRRDGVRRVPFRTHRERPAPRVPWRHVTVRHADAGSCWAKANTLSGRWRRVRRTNVGGRPKPRYFGAANGARPGAQTVVSLLVPTMYGMP